ncbi:MAG: hypothetical protein ACLPJW_10690 [Rhodomicrobium sp.]
MRCSAVLSGVLSCGLSVAAWQGASAEITPNLPTISLRSGETLEVMDLWYAINCASQLNSAPLAEVMEGPSEVTVSIKEAMVVPREQDCDKPIGGGKLLFSAKDVHDYSASTLTVRITYDTKDGERKPTYSFNIILLPKQD